MYENILIDFTNLFFRSIYFGIEQEKSILSIPRHFLFQIEQIKNKFGNENTIVWFLCDDSNYLLRRELDLEYKQNRKKEKLPNLIFSFIGLLQEIVKSQNENYRVISEVGLEADDFVKPTLNLLKGSKNLLISYDLDFARGIDTKIEKTDWYNWNDIYNEISFIQKYSFYPNCESVKLYKSLNGYKSDNIKVGVKDLSPLTLFQICRKAIDYKSFESFENDLYWIEKSDRNKIIKSFEQIEINYQLCNFISLEKEFNEYIEYGSKNKIQLKILLESLGLQLKLSKEEIENEFFDLL